MSLPTPSPTALRSPLSPKGARENVETPPVGETHGQGPSSRNAIDRKGVEPRLFQLGEKQYNPFGVGKSSGHIIPAGFTHGWSFYILGRSNKNLIPRPLGERVDRHPRFHQRGRDG